jgi:hypothetical protein
MPGHSSSPNPSPSSHTGVSGHNIPGAPASSSPPPYQGAPGSPHYPLPPYAPYPPYPPYPQPGSGYPYLPPLPGSDPSVPPTFHVLPPIVIPPPPRQRSSLKPLWITLGIATTLLVVLCITCSVIFSLSLARFASQTTGSTQVSAELEPVLAAQNFCAYETNKDYASAYQQLSINLQTEVSLQQFESDNQARDASLGSVVGCSAARQLPASSAEGTASSPSILMVYIWLTGSTTSGAPPPSRSGSMTMVLESSSWKVDAVDRTLQLT